MVTYQEIEDRASKVGLGRICRQVLEEVRLSLPSYRRTVNRALEVFSRWWEIRDTPDSERNENAYILLYLFREKLEEKEKVSEK